MWHAIAPVGEEYDPILYEGEEPVSALVINAGPGNVVARTWLEVWTNSEPRFAIELRPGDQRIINGSLLRVHLTQGHFAAVAWRILDMSFDI